MRVFVMPLAPPCVCTGAHTHVQIVQIASHSVRVEKVLGEGGLATVYKAVDSQGTPYALKHMRFANADAVSDMTTEARTLAKVHSAQQHCTSSRSILWRSLAACQAYKAPWREGKEPGQALRAPSAAHDALACSHRGPCTCQPPALLFAVLCCVLLADHAAEGPPAHPEALCNSIRGARRS